MRLSFAGHLLLAWCATQTFSREVVALELLPQVDVHSTMTSNAFMDASHEADVTLRPGATLSVNLSDAWSTGYSGDLTYYLEHTELTSHWHEIYVAAVPTWGEEQENEVFVEARAETIRNQSEYAAINVVRPSVIVRITQEPAWWFRWTAAVSSELQWFYDDAPANTLDAWVDAGFTFTLPIRATLSLRARGAARYYPKQDESVTSDNRDFLAELGFHASKGLWETAGIQLDYAFVALDGSSGQLARKLTEAQFVLLGDAFLFAGHRAAAGFKQLLGESSSFGASLLVEKRRYPSWPALNAAGEISSEDREDFRLIPSAYLDLSTSGPSPEWGLTAEYSFVRQVSNTDWYDTNAHVLALLARCTW